MPTLQDITGNENLLILAPHPGDESFCCGGLIAQSCRRGRPPFVMILDDGSATPAAVPDPAALAARHERETRAAVHHLGLPRERLLLVGLFDGTLQAMQPDPRSDPTFDAVVRAVILVMWARDCNVVCAPAPDAPDPAHRAAHRIALEVATRSGVALLTYAGAQLSNGLHLDITPDLPAKRAALAAHTARPNLASIAPRPIEAFASAPPGG